MFTQWKKSLTVIYTMTVLSVLAVSAGATATLNYKVVSDWGSAFQGTITVTNTSDQAYENWSLEFDYPYDIGSLWDAQKIGDEYNRYTIVPPAWKPNLNPGESHTFGFIANPGNATVQPSNIKFNGGFVGPPNGNTEPVAKDDSVSTNVNTHVTIDVLINDSDADGDTLQITDITTPSKGAAVLDLDKIVYTPDNGITGNDSFTYKIDDGNGGVSSALVTIKILDDTVVTGNNVEFKVSSDWSSGFNGDITITNNTDKAFNSWTLEFDFPYNITGIWNAKIESHNGNHYVVKNLSWNGTLSVGKSVSFGFGGSPGNVTEEPYNITLNGVPVGSGSSKPTAVNDSAETEVNTSIYINTLTNDNGEELILVNVTVPSNGSAEIQGSQIIYSPNADFSGSDSFMYTVEDTNGDTATATVYVMIKQLEEVKAIDDNYSTYENTSATIDVLSNDTGANRSIRGISGNPDNGTAVIENNKIKYSPNADFNGNDSFLYEIESGGIISSATVFVTILKKSDLDKFIVGNWHNWDYPGAPAIKLTDVNEKYNVIHISFAESVSYTDPTMRFILDTNIQSKESFKQDIKELQAQGRKVIISMGGANAFVQLKSNNDKQLFTDSMINIMEEYNFDGLDVDLEQGSVSLDANDGDFRNSTTVSIINLIDSIRDIHDYFNAKDKKIIISLVPEVGHVQQGMEAYRGVYGSYLPVMYGLRDIMTYVAPQYMNVGSGNRIIALDGQKYQNGTKDFIVAMTEMLLKGFPVINPVTGDTIQFPALREDQVGFACPATPIAAPAGGYMEPEEMIKALNYLTKGESFGGSYNLLNQKGYPDIRGMVTWSINWDNTTEGETAVDEWVNSYYDYFYGDSEPEDNEIDQTSPVVTFLSHSDGENIELEVLSPIELLVMVSDLEGTISSITIQVDGVSYEGTSAQWTPADFGDYTITATAIDNSGNVTVESIGVIIAQHTVTEPPVQVISKKKINGYFAEWSIYDRNYQVTDIPVKYVTHINYAFLELKDGIIQIWDKWAAVDKRFPEVEKEYGVFPAGDWNGTKEYYGNFERLNRLDELVNQFYNKDIKIIATLGGWTGSDGFPEMTRTFESRKKFIDSFTEFLKKYKFEGICYDWEFPVLGAQFSYTEPKLEESGQLVALVKETREDFDKLTMETGIDYEMIVSFNCAEKNIKDIDIKTISDYADHIDTMTFDVCAVAWGNAAGHQSPIYHNPENPDSFNDSTFQQGTVDAAVKYLLSIGVPNEKIMIGSPQYGRSGSGVEHLFQEDASSGGGTWENAAYDYDSIIGKSNKINLPTNPSFYYWDNIAQASYYINSNGEFVSYDSLQAVEAKCKYINEQNLGGWFIWEFSGNRNAELINTAYETMNIE
ncbi:MAG TPA: glycosyl hydrolase family 18 protein [Victivallales bacterium]|nr:glycosyl hydrolase family 18 protein [Victivallales bacterium]